MKAPSDDLKTVPYSKAEACTPELVEFTDLYGDPPDYGDRVRKLGEDCSSRTDFRLARLDRPGSGSFFLHVYNGTGGELQLMIYGLTESGEAKPILQDCYRIAAIARRIVVSNIPDPFPTLLVRFGYDRKASATASVSLAAYDGKEPGSPGSIVTREWDRCRDPEQDNEEPANNPTLEFNCGDKSFQRIILSGCSEKVNMREWVRRTGLEVSEEYYGEKGSVVALGVPPGMDLNTTGGSAGDLRAEVNHGEGTVSPDYIVNLFNPRSPTDKSGKLVRAENDPEIKETICNAGDYFGECLPPRRPPEKFDQNRKAITVAIIDSGVDYSDVNRHRWEPTRYRQRKETEFVKPWKLGFDFIAKDFEPEDETPHGTHVAGALLAQYQSDRPLNLLHLKAFGAGGISTYFGALVSIYEAIAVGAKVINLSWGIVHPDPLPALECAIKTAAEHNIFMVTSAGNDGRDLEKTPQWPAAFASQFRDHLLAVASYWYQRFTFNRNPDKVDLMHWSNFGDGEVPVAAFMTTGVPEFETGTTFYPLGTSISTPIVAGILANWLAENPDGTLGQFSKAFFREATSIADRVTDGCFLPLESTAVPT